MDNEVIRDLRDQLTVLATAFAEFELAVPDKLSAPLRQGSRPSVECVSGLLDLVDRFDSLHAQVRLHGGCLDEPVTIESMLRALDGARAAETWNTFVSEAHSLLENIPRITHPAEVCPPALLGVQNAAARLLSELPELSDDLEAWKARILPFAALWKLVNDADLDDLTTEQLETEVASAFGETVVRRSFITRLRITSSPAASPKTPPHAIVPEPASFAQPLAKDDTSNQSATTDGEGLRDAAAESPSVVQDSTPSSDAFSAAGRPDKQGNARALNANPGQVPAAPLSPASVIVDPLPDYLKTFDAFKSRYWLNPTTGECEAAPWHGDGVVTALREMSWTILAEIAAGNDARFPELWLAARSLEAAGTPVISGSTVRSIAELIEEPTRAAAGRDSHRAQRISRLGGDSSAEVRLALTLEAIRPTTLALATDGERDRLFAVAEFRDGTIKSVLGELFRAHAQGLVEPLEQIRAALKTNGQKRPDPKAELAARRKALDAELVRLQRNAGNGYVGIFDHCSAAWMEFMRSHARPLAVRLEGMRGQNDASPTVADVEHLLESYRFIADECVAREKARRIMDRAAESLVRHLADVVNARQAVADAEKVKAPPTKRLIDEAARLIALPAPTDPIERLGLRLLRLSLDPSNESGRKSLLCLGTRFHSAYPSLLDLFDEPLDWNKLPTADDLASDKPEIAATLIHPRSDLLGDGDRKSLENRCREERRYERLAKLRSPLPTQDQANANQEKNRLAIELQHRKDRLRKGWRALEGLLVASQAETRRILEGLDGMPSLDGMASLICAWLDRVCEFTDQQVAAATNHWRRIFSDDPAAQARLAALDAGQYARATSELYGATLGFSPLRETVWRHEAKLRFPEPRRVLLSSRDQSSVAEKWLADLQDRGKRHNALASLQSDFIKWVFPPSLISAGSKDRTTFTIETQAIRNYLSPAQPTYLPQLHNAKELVITTVPEWPNATGYRKQVQEVISNHRDNRIVVLLCPGMTAEHRDQIRRELHSTSHFAAIIDDLDLVRLLNPGGPQPDLLIGLFELVLEQQPRKARNPFSLPDGKEMRLEMYVGRRDEAEQLATTSAKTRLFSGRKLGKTALLQFIRQTWNSRELPNGRTLRVVYLSIVGVSSEENFAKKFLEQLRIDFPSLSLPESLRHPFDIEDVIKTILDAAPTEDVLFVIDEADAFVADQVRLDSVRKGQGLSWKLRDIQHARFVFTGYWATATRDGAWYNWGDVLELSQLQPEEAAGLIAHPLARMGLDAADQASEIAFRCGYQPAVLLRFGEALVERLGQDTMRDHVVVSHDVVQDVFADVKVQKEIQGVVRANFQANPLGHAIFCVVLQESARAPLGYWLADLESTVATLFDPMVDESVKADLRATIAAQLRDMHQRKLLRRRVRLGQAEYQLTFPHHLATLLQDLDIDAEIKADLRAWRQTHAGGGDAPLGEGRSPIHRLDLAAVRDVLNPELAEYAPKVVVVASTWPASLLSEPGGVPERLGLPLRVQAAADYSPQSETRCWQSPNPSDLERVIASPPVRRPAFFFGDISVLRAALAHRAKGDLDLDVVGTHRFTDGQVRWWFQRIQGVELASAGDYEQVHRITGGVPFLVEAFQVCLMPNGSPDGGMTPSAETLSEAMSEFQRLIDGGSLAHRLRSLISPRELELLRMVVTVSEEGVGVTSNRFQPIVEFIWEDWSSVLFEDAWRRNFSSAAFPDPYGGRQDDLIALDTLVLSGAVRSRRDNAPAAARLLAFEKDDPIVAIVKQLQ